MFDSNPPVPPRRFSSDCLVSTQGAYALMESAGVSAFDLRDRHFSGDWGDVDAEDAAANEMALREGSRMLSVYRFPVPCSDALGAAGGTVWVITEADRSATTVLLPEEY